MYLFVPIALTDNAPAALFQIAGPPRRIQIVKRDKAILHVHASAHLKGTSHQDAHLTGAHLGEQLLFANLGIGFMDKGDLFTRNAHGNQLVSNIIVNREFRLRRNVDLRFQSVKLRIIQIPRNGFRRFCWRRAGFRCG